MSERICLFLKAYKEILLEIICLALSAFTWTHARREKMIEDAFIWRDAVLDISIAIAIVAAAYIGMKYVVPPKAIQLHFIIFVGLGTVLGVFFGVGGTAGATRWIVSYNSKA
jgi:hypothetical protein